MESCFKTIDYYKVIQIKPIHDYRIIKLGYLVVNYPRIVFVA